MPSNVLVSGLIGTAALLNGLYKYDSELLGSPYYKCEVPESPLGINNLFKIPGTGWWLEEFATTGGGYSIKANPSEIDKPYPWLVNNWYSDELDPAELANISVSEVPISSQPTFGLPADVVALITSRFGTVANFLRLRNQGQI